MDQFKSATGMLVFCFLALFGLNALKGSAARAQGHMIVPFPEHARLVAQHETCDEWEITPWPDRAEHPGRAEPGLLVYGDDYSMVEIFAVGSSTKVVLVRR